jgi:hypothetical protein
MGGGFRDLEEFLVVEPVVLPIRGKDYAFPGQVSARTWLLLQDLAEREQRARKAIVDGENIDLDEVVVPDDVEDHLMDELLGEAKQEMIDDGLTSSHFKAVLYTLIAYHLEGRDSALEVWTSRGNRGPRTEPSADIRRSRRLSLGAPAVDRRAHASRQRRNVVRHPELLGADRG